MPYPEVNLSSNLPPTMNRAICSLSCLVVATGCLRPPPIASNGNVATPASSAQVDMPAGGAWPWQGGRPVAIKLNPSKVLREVTARHFGNNASWWAGKSWTLDPDRLDKARQARFRFWRWPGGSSSDEYLWDGNGAKWGNGPEGKNSTHMNESWAANTDDFLSLLQQVNGEGIITLNYGIARYGKLELAVELARSWVKDLNIDKHANIELFEIGNELFGPWETGHNVPGKPELTGAMYGSDTSVICAAIKSVDPKVKCGAVAVAHDSGDEWTGYKWWMRDMLPQIETSIDYLIVHEYFAWPFQNDQFVSPSNEAIFSNIKKIREGADSVAAMTRKYTKRAQPFPLALTEFNVLNGNVPQTLQLINGLFTAEVLGESIAAGYLATNFWDWRNGYDPKHGGGDHALLASGDPAVPDDTPRPAYYAYAVFARAFGEQMVEATSNDHQVKVYASRFKNDSKLGLVFVNEREEPARVTIAGAEGKTKLTGWVLTGASLNSTKVTFNGAKGPDGGGGPFPVDSLAPYQQALAGTVELTLPKASLAGLVLAP
jgi:hypothetical protein